MNETTHSPHAGRNWLPYALLEISPERNSGDRLESWLKDALSPLGLPADFTGKVFASARDSAACVPAEAQQIRLQIFTCAVQPAAGHTWGFFRIMKQAGPPASPAGSIHEIAFYLYIDGPTMPG